MPFTRNLFEGRNCPILKGSFDESGIAPRMVQMEGDQVWIGSSSASADIQLYGDVTAENVTTTTVSCANIDTNDIECETVGFPDGSQIQSHIIQYNNNPANWPLDTYADFDVGNAKKYSRIAILSFTAPTAAAGFVTITIAQDAAGTGATIVARQNCNSTNFSIVFLCPAGYFWKWQRSSAVTITTAYLQALKY